MVNFASEDKSVICMFDNEYEICLYHTKTPKS